MIRLADDTRIFIAIGHTDMRKGFDGLAIWYRRLEQGTYQLSHAGPSDNGMEVRCECCGEIWCEIGGESSEQLEFIPAQWKVIQHDRVKYACQSCQEHVTLAPKPPQPIEKGLPGPGLAAHTTLSKTGDHTPLYRQEDIHSRIGWTVRRSTLCC
jgi:transposase